jgi:hypothetical protein
MNENVIIEPCPNRQIRPTPHTLGGEGIPNHHRRYRGPGQTDSELLIGRTVFGGRGDSRYPPRRLTTEFQFVASLYGSPRLAEMLRVVTPLLRQM